MIGMNKISPAFGELKVNIFSNKGTNPQTGCPYQDKKLENIVKKSIIKGNSEFSAIKELDKKGFDVILTLLSADKGPVRSELQVLTELAVKGDNFEVVNIEKEIPAKTFYVNTQTDIGYKKAATITGFTLRTKARKFLDIVKTVEKGLKGAKSEN